MVTRSMSGATFAKGSSHRSGGKKNTRSKPIRQVRNGPSRCWGFPGVSWDNERVEGILAHFHRPCLSDKRNLACSSTSRFPRIRK